MQQVVEWNIHWSSLHTMTQPGHLGWMGLKPRHSKEIGFFTSHRFVDVPSVQWLERSGAFQQGASSSLGRRCLPHLLLNKKIAGLLPLWSHFFTSHRFCLTETCSAFRPVCLILSLDELAGLQFPPSSTSDNVVTALVQSSDEKRPTPHLSNLRGCYALVENRSSVLVGFGLQFQLRNRN
jgi:hypothetical protein